MYVLQRNPSFEDTTDQDPLYWDTFSWTQGDDAVEFKFVNNVSKSGEKSVFINNKKANHSRFKQRIKTKPDTVYKITSFAKTDGVKGEIGANIFIENSHAMSNNIVGASDRWEYLELYGKTGSKQKDRSNTPISFISFLLSPPRKNSS